MKFIFLKGLRLDSQYYENRAELDNGKDIIMSKKITGKELLTAYIAQNKNKTRDIRIEKEIVHQFSFLGESVVKSAITFYQEKIGKEYSEIGMTALKGALRQNFEEEFQRKENEEIKKNETIIFERKVYDQKKKMIVKNMIVQEEGNIITMEYKILEEYPSDGINKDAECLYSYGIKDIGFMGDISLGEWFGEANYGEFYTEVLPNGKEAHFLVPNKNARIK